MKSKNCENTKIVDKISKTFGYIISFGVLILLMILVTLGIYKLIGLF